jgi:hypothetical protein
MAFPNEVFRFLVEKISQMQLQNHTKMQTKFVFPEGKFRFPFEFNRNEKVMAVERWPSYDEE